VQVSDSFLDTAEPQSIATSRDIQADAVVGHRHVQPIVVPGHLHLNGVRLRVPDAIGQGFLDGSIHAGPIAIR
jgi:hypothetical protein